MKKLPPSVIGPRRQPSLADIHQEIQLHLLPHISGEADHGYPFSGMKGMFKVRLLAVNNLRLLLCDLDRACRQMPDHEGEALYYLAARDLRECVERWIEFAKVLSRPAA